MDLIRLPGRDVEWILSSDPVDEKRPFIRHPGFLEDAKGCVTSIALAPHEAPVRVTPDPAEKIHDLLSTVHGKGLVQDSCMADHPIHRDVPDACSVIEVEGAVESMTLVAGPVEGHRSRGLHRRLEDEKDEKDHL